MPVRFQVVEVNSLIRLNHPQVEGFNESAFDGVNCIIDRSCEPCRILGFDRGEMEDNTFTRDYDWIAKELNSLDEQLMEGKHRMESLA